MIESDELLIEFFYMLMEIQSNRHEAKEQAKSMMGRYSLTKNELALIQFLSGEPDIQVNELAEMLGLSSSTIVIRLNTLEDNELIIRERNKQDRRKVYIQLSEKGKKIVSEMKFGPPVHLIKNLMSLDESAKSQFIKILKTINGNKANKEKMKKLRQEQLKKFLGF